MKTAVEWLIEQMKTYNMTVSVHNTSHQNVMDFYKAIEQAKGMEKQQMVEFTQNYVFEYVTCSYDGIPDPLKEVEQYYNETYKSE